MRLALCTPLRALSSARPSGDTVIPQELKDFLTGRGHEVLPAPELATRGLVRTPYRWPEALMAGLRTRAFLARERPELWLTYHSYHKAPDLLGPLARACGVPYVIFAGSYATRPRKQLATRPGFLLNRRALLAAELVIANTPTDHENLRRLLPDERILAIPAALDTHPFAPDPATRDAWRAAWRGTWGASEDTVVILVAAMLRPGVKAEGVAWAIRAVACCVSQNLDCRLAVAGDGPAEEELRALAERLLPGRVHFSGRVPRAGMAGFYAAGDLLAFPGINEGIGMCYLEAQCAGLPVVATDHHGAPAVIRNGETGFITPYPDEQAFAEAVTRLAGDQELRGIMGAAARAYVLAVHDRETVYGRVEAALLELASRSGRSPAPGTVRR